MDKITLQHRERLAYVYVRQSTMQQVHHNKESQRVQYGLVQRAKVLGFSKVEVIDDDLGVSGSGITKRFGFEKLLAEICQGHVGAILAVEASRFARNGREWHTLLDMCGLVNTLIIDLDSVYDPTLTNDRMLLGMKGTLSEMELSLFRQRSQAAMKEKAARGELYSSVAVGYLPNDKRLEKDPDQRIQQAIQLVFTKFKELKSMRQVLLWLRREEATLPTTQYYDGVRFIEWRLPVYNTIRNILINPIYAGCYAYGRTVTETKIENGKKKVIRGVYKELSEWQVLIKDHHEGYTDWTTYEFNQKLIRDNANMKGSMVRGSVKKGQALLAGLIRCGHCGRKILVHYSKTQSIRYQCNSAHNNHGGSICIGFSGLNIDKKISELLLEVVSPYGAEAAQQAVDTLEEERDELRQHHELSLKQARYDAERIERQYAAVEPENRLVAVALEERWNEALKKVAQCEKVIAAMPDEYRPSETEKLDLLTLGQQLETVWYAKETPITFKKQIARALIHEIIANLEEDCVKLVIHWEGGVHTKLVVKKNKVGQTRFMIPLEDKQLIGELARYMTDPDIASLLTRLGKKTGRGLSWTQTRITAFRKTHDISVYKENEHHQRGELKVAEVCEKLELPSHTVIRLIKSKQMPAKQACKGAPWIIKREIVDKWLSQYGKRGEIRPLTENENQATFDFSTT